MVEEFGDADEHLQVNTGAFEHLIDIAALAVDGIGEPSHSAPLRPQFRLNHPAYVNVAHIDAVFYRV